MYFLEDLGEEVHRKISGMQLVCHAKCISVYQNI